jgi:uridine phosphorylase
MEMIFQKISEYEKSGLKACNLEMETAGIYLLGRMLGHRTLSLNAIIANRMLGQFSKDPYAVVDKLIQHTLRNLIV